MKELGISAKELIILACYVSDVFVDAMKLRDAGYSLAELVNCFPSDKHPARRHPPLTPRTLFDSQLQKAGYTAFDFRNAGYTAHELSKAFFWRGYSRAKLTAGKAQWEECHAFFSASELINAGYSLEELEHAKFSGQEIEDAGLR